METGLHSNVCVREESITDFGLVSIIMPNYNGSDYIKEAIDSIVAQTYRNWELIVVDDCSKDDSLTILQQYEDDRIRILKNTENSGAAVSRNNAIAVAKGRWIAFLDSDDSWGQDKLARQLAFMQERQSVFSCTDYTVINSENKLVAEFTPSRDVHDYKTILKHCYIGCSTVIYDSLKLGKVYMPTNAIKREDFACWLQILRTGVKADHFHESLTIYRVHSNSVSSKKTKMIKYQWRVYRKVEKLSFFSSVFYMAHWAVLGVLKYK